MIDLSTHLALFFSRPLPRMASADLFRPYSKLHDDDGHDHIATVGSSTPPGASTPRPDLSDKRLPGLINSFFGQVRDNSLRTRSTSVVDSVNSPAHLSSQQAPTQKETSQLERACSTSPEHPRGYAEPTSAHQPLDHADWAPLLPHEKTHLNLKPIALPTPPSSKSGSFRSAMGGGVSLLPLAIRRNTRCSSPPSLTLATPAVSAHISGPPSDDTSATALSRHTLARSISESRVLTSGAERDQNTPPQTPRHGSYSAEAKEAPKAAKAVDMSRTSSASGGNNSTIGQLKGQLEVTIEEGRGLRPSVDPYVVCIFQLNEDISDGPRESDVTREISPDAEEGLAKGVAMKRIGSGSGGAILIPGLRSRQTSQTDIAALRKHASRPGTRETTEPQWKHTAIFDVVGENSEMDISVYDRSNNEAFIGHIRLPLTLEDYEHKHSDWYKLQSRDGKSDRVSGEIRLNIAFRATGKKTFGPDDFEILKLIGKGTFGQVFQVRKRDTKRIYAMKVLSKKVIVQKKEIQHTIGERNILVRTATTESPFIVGLKFSFQTATDLYLVTDYMSGGELFWHLQKEGKFLENRAKFYIAELILALRHLHQHDIVYRDLKPENILLDANGHIALCDFGLSKANLAKNDTTNTFCGTTEYLAPEVLLDEQGYTKMVDFWSLGVLVFEMCCGWSPFYAEDTQQMYKNIAFGKVKFPRDVLSPNGRNFVKGLLNRNPTHRLGAQNDAEELMGHLFFHDIDWTALSKKLTQPPFKPKLKGELDTSNFDPEFTNALEGNPSSSLNARAAALASGTGMDSTPLSPTLQNHFKGFTFVDESSLELQYADRDVDDGVNLSRSGKSKSIDRMSGIEPLGAASDGDFNHGILEDL